MEVGAWLHGLGLGQYEQVFRDNAVDAEVLRDLGDTDLEKLGVLLGHRKSCSRPSRRCKAGRHRREFRSRGRLPREPGRE